MPPLPSFFRKRRDPLIRRLRRHLLPRGEKGSNDAASLRSTSTAPKFLAGLLLLAVASPALAGDIEVQAPWLRATPKGASVAGGYATIVNHGVALDWLLGASLPVAPKGEVHEMSMQDGVMHMARLADGLAIAPGATVVLTPSGYHLMFNKPSKPLKEGEKISGTLTFAKAGKVDVTFAVAGFGAKAAPGMPSH